MKLIALAALGAVVAASGSGSGCPALTKKECKKMGRAGGECAFVKEKIDGVKFKRCKGNVCENMESKRSCKKIEKWGGGTKCDYDKKNNKCCTGACPTTTEAPPTTTAAATTTAAPTTTKRVPTGKRYELSSSITLARFECFAVCKEKGGSLPEIRTVTERNGALAVGGPGTRIWTNLRKVGDNKHTKESVINLRWEDGKGIRYNEADLSLWHVPEPNNASTREDFGELWRRGTTYNGKLNDTEDYLPTSKVHGCVCEFDTYDR